MKKIGFVLAVVAVLCLATNASAGKNANGKWALHYAGIHNAKANTCTTSVPTICEEIVTTGPSEGTEHYDVYILAVDVAAIAGAMYGLTCDGDVYFYGWTNCADLEIPSENWPGCGEDLAQVWSTEQPGPIVPLGILEVYVYAASNSFSTNINATEGFAQWCDQSPLPVCFETDGSEPRYFGTIGFNGETGHNPCGDVPTVPTTWGQVKALYQ